MAKRLETESAVVCRARAEFDDWSPSILLSEPEAAAITGFSPHTLKGWRLSKSPKGPQPIYRYEKVFYSVAEIRRWLAATQSGQSA
jgi:hypothetical protein